MNDKSFLDLGVSEATLKALDKKGFTSPSAIQTLVIPELLKERTNLIGQAQTGTGKTAAFAIPILETLDCDGSVRAIVLAPTRELANQVADEMYSLRGKKEIKVLPVYGGQSIDQQIKKIKKGIDVIVGTPGRILDLMNRKVIKLNNLEYFVLDEADEMLNMGFIEDIELILERTNEDKKMLFFSATIPDSIMKIAKKFMKDYILLKVKTKELTTNLTEQIYFEVTEGDKFEALCRVLDYVHDFYGIVFCRTKSDVDDVAQHLKGRGYDAEAIHGDITQAMRMKTLEDFKKKRINILVATDVAARGIDVNDLTHVINYSIPQEPESYVHRIGRTGRAGKKGIAITFVTPKEASKISKIQRLTKTDIKKEKIPKIEEVISVKKENLYACVEEIEKEEDFGYYTGMAKELLGDKDPEVVLASLLRHMYDDEFLPESYNEISEVKTGRGLNANNAGDDKTRLFIALGKKDGYTPGKLLDLLNKKAKTPGRKVRDIKIMDNFSFITVPLREAEFIMKALNKSNKNKPLVEKAKKK